MTDVRTTERVHCLMGAVLGDGYKQCEPVITITLLYQCTLLNTLLVCLFLDCLLSMILVSDRTNWALAFVCFSIFFFTARCTLVQSAVLPSHVFCLSVRPSVCDVGEL